MKTKPRFDDLLGLHQQRSQQVDGSANQQTKKLASKQMTKPAKRQSKKLATQQASKLAIQQAVDPNEPTAGIGARVPRSWRVHWTAEAKRQDTSITQAIIDAMTERFGLPEE